MMFAPVDDNVGRGEPFLFMLVKDFGLFSS